jgi:16S rRNA C1402 (ribose-2'-O) methylase RsmI
MEKTGILYIVTTSIGNLTDMTYRVVEILKGVDTIAAEDTRHNRKLLNHYNINVRLLSVHEHNESQRIPQIIEYLNNGNDITLIEDLISILGNKHACLTREITKIHEDYIRGTLGALLHQLRQRETIKGECSFFVQGNTASNPMTDKELDLIVLASLKK